MTPIALLAPEEDLPDQQLPPGPGRPSPLCVARPHRWCFVCAPLSFSLAAHDKEVARRRWRHDPAALAAASPSPDTTAPRPSTGPPPGDAGSLRQAVAARPRHRARGSPSLRRKGDG